jgi:hypothetical protein
MVPLTPPTEPSFAVTVWVVPAAVFVVKLTVAMPLGLVADVGLPKDPPPVLLHVTVRETVTGLLKASASCAATVIAAPATGTVLLVETMYFVAGPATYVTSGSPVVIADDPMEALTDPLPRTVGAVSVAV